MLVRLITRKWSCGRNEATDYSETSRRANTRTGAARYYSVDSSSTFSSSSSFLLPLALPPPHFIGLVAIFFCRQFSPDHRLLRTTFRNEKQFRPVTIADANVYVLACYLLLQRSAAFCSRHDLSRNIIYNFIISRPFHGHFCRINLSSSSRCASSRRNHRNGDKSWSDLQRAPRYLFEHFVLAFARGKLKRIDRMSWCRGRELLYVLGGGDALKRKLFYFCIEERDIFCRCRDAYY